jgi:translocation and assembly module TamA
VARLLALLCLWGCAELPAHRYGVDDLQIEGMQALDEEALRSCLATEDRDKVTLGLGALSARKCGEPPFDQRRRSARLFAFAWKDWPVYDAAVFKLDLERAKRWYEARGYYGVRVLDVSYDPPAAKARDTLEGAESAEGEKVDITIRVEEGEPVRIRKVELSGVNKLDFALQQALRESMELVAGQVFDESLYDVAREHLAATLRDHGYAHAKVLGDVLIHKRERAVDITLKVESGPLCQIGEVRIASKVSVPAAPILAVTQLKRGQTFRSSDLADAQRAIYALGAFGAVTVRPDPDDLGNTIDVLLELEPRRESEWLIGAGLMSGVLSTGAAAEEWVSVPQWDVHLTGSYEHRNFLGGLRRLRIEERPRLLFVAAFPATSRPDVPDASGETTSHKGPSFGNTLQLTFTQPGVIEPRTSLFVETRWDYGPDPFLLFFRHDFGTAVGLTRWFFRQKLYVRVAVHQEVMQVTDWQPILENRPTPSSYLLPFLEQRITVDLRDDPGNPSKGAYFGVGVHEALKLFDPSWNYVRVTPEARGYAPLGLGVVLAGRFSVGSLHIFDASPSLDEDAENLGPQSYRLRGGGAQSNRGFGPGQLGDGVTGGIRRWESSLELRVPLAQSFSLAFFGDVGDVHARPSFRFSHLNTGVGGGLRYRTIIGPIRFDVGYRPDKLQRADGSSADDAPPRMNLGFTRFQGAVHLTIGEAF